MKCYLYVIFIICFFSVNRSSAQKVLPGFYLNLNGDTINGSFEYKEWDNNPAQVTFINNNKNAVQLLPAGCLQFTVSGVETYVSRRFERLINPIEFTMTDNRWDTSDQYESKHGFLLLLAESDSYTLLVFKDKIRENFFMEHKATGALAELKNKVIMESNTNMLKYVDTYKKQLYSFYSPIAGEAYKLSDRLNNLAYDEKSLIAFVQSFSTKTSSIKKSKAYPAEFLVFGGGAYNTLTVTPNDPGIIQTQLNYPSAISPVFGIGYTSYGQRNFGKNFFQLQLRYSSFKNTGKNNSNNSEITYQAKVVSFNAGLGRKWIQTGAFSWFTSLLSSYQLLINNKEVHNPPGSENKGVNSSLNALVETGITLKRFRLGVSSSLLATRTHNYVYFSPKQRSVQLTAGFSL
ncbi:MAG: hypothetical protein JWQ96_2234 [Segetibacter sp.]|nr:hypothetical protein [Segetibacter sp.]